MKIIYHSVPNWATFLSKQAFHIHGLFYTHAYGLALQQLDIDVTSNNCVRGSCFQCAGRFCVAVALNVNVSTAHARMVYVCVSATCPLGNGAAGLSPR